MKPSKTFDLLIEYYPEESVGTFWNKYRNTHNRSKCKCKDLVKPDDAIKIGDLGWLACGLLEP